MRSACRASTSPARCEPAASRRATPLRHAAGIQRHTAYTAATATMAKTMRFCVMLTPRK